MNGSNRRRLSALVAWCSLPLLSMAADHLPQPSGVPRPNVLFICVDDLKPLLGCYEHPEIKSPNIDRLAARGVQFDKAYCNQAVCAPSRNALMTGIRSTSLGIYDLGTNFRKSRPDAITVAQLFRQNGWHTEAMGKIFHVGHGNHEDAASWSVPHWSPRWDLYALEQNRPKPLADPAAAAPRGAASENADVPDETYSDGAIANEAIKRLRLSGSRTNQPFFMAVGFHRPHLPFVAPKKYWDLYRRDSFKPHPRQSAPEGAPEFAPTTWGELRQYSDIPKVGLLDPEKQKELMHGYCAAVSYMDAQVGRVLDELERLNLSTNTIIMLWGDHGWHLGDHGMWCKHTNYEEANRIPVLMVAPGVAQPGSRCRALIESVDIYPTLCDLAGLEKPAQLEGRSFVNALRDPAGARTKDFVYHVYPRSPKGMGPILGRALRTDRYRLVEWKRPGAPADSAIIELYDYQTDPQETKNAASDQPEIVKALLQKLAALPEAKPQLPSADPAAKSKSKQKKAKKTDPV